MGLETDFRSHSSDIDFNSLVFVVFIYNCFGEKE